MIIVYAKIIDLINLAGYKPTTAKILPLVDSPLLLAALPAKHGEKSPESRPRTYNIRHAGMQHVTCSISMLIVMPGHCGHND